MTPQTRPLPSPVSSIGDASGRRENAAAKEKPTPAQFAALITPPESPVDGVVSRDDLPAKPDDQHIAARSDAILVGETVYPPGQIRSMMESLSQARRNGELPPTFSSPMDGRAVVEDYGYLTQLREARGDLSAPAPETYNCLRIDITRRIQERDELLSEQSNKEEAARRVNSYLRSVEKERLYFEAANTMLQQRGISQPTQVDLDNISEEILAVVEHAVEQNIIDATAPLRMNAKRMDDSLLSMRRENADLHDQNDTLSRQIDLHYRTLERFDESFNSHVRALNDMFQPQADSLAAVTGIVSHLSQMAVNLPTAINHVVYAAVQHQAQAAMQQVMDAQQRVMLSLHEEEQRLSEGDGDRSMGSGENGADIEALATAVTQKMNSERATPRSGAIRSRGKFRTALRRVFKGRAANCRYL